MDARLVQRPGWASRGSDIPARPLQRLLPLSTIPDMSEIPPEVCEGQKGPPCLNLPSSTVLWRGVNHGALGGEQLPPKRIKSE